MKPTKKYINFNRKHKDLRDDMMARAEVVLDLKSRKFLQIMSNEFVLWCENNCRGWVGRRGTRLYFEGKADATLVILFWSDRLPPGSSFGPNTKSDPL